MAFIGFAGDKMITVLAALSFKSSTDSNLMMHYAGYHKEPVFSVSPGHVLTWAGLKRFYHHVPHGSAANVLVQDSSSLQIRLSTQSVFGYTQSFLLQLLI